jgi:hypothetical protein
MSQAASGLSETLVTCGEWDHKLLFHILHLLDFFFSGVGIRV